MPVALQPFTLTCTVEIPPILKDLMNKSYKWYRNGQLLHNETKSTLTFESVMLMVDDKASLYLYIHGNVTIFNKSFEQIKHSIHC